MFKHNAQRGVSTRTVSPGLRRQLVSFLLVGACVCAMSGQARAEDDPGALKDKAVAGQVADVSSTAIGLALGAAEANPLGLVTLGVKAIAYQHIKDAPAAEQPAMWSAYGAFGWGATANNVCVIATIASGGAAAALCPLVGLFTGMTVYSGDEDKRNRDTFAAICEQQRQINPKITCEYRGSSS